MIRLYYHNDMDGVTSKEIIKYRCRNLFKEGEYKEYWMNYGPLDREKYSEVEEGDTVFIVDLSFTDKTADIFQDIHKKAATVTWIDHHDSSLKFRALHKGEFLPEQYDGKYPNNIWYFVCKDYGSAALMCYIADFPEVTNPYTIDGIEIAGNILPIKYVPKFVQFVSDYDTFAGEMLPESDWFKLAYDQDPNKHELIASLLAFTGTDIEIMLDAPNTTRVTNELLAKGKELKKYIDTNNAGYLRAFGYESTLPAEITREREAIPVYVCNKSSNSWVFGDKYDEYKYVITWAFNGTEYSYSIYSNLKKFPDSDGKYIAEQFGGGGHNGAAGWRSANLMFIENGYIPWRR